MSKERARRRAEREAARLAAEAARQRRARRAAFLRRFIPARPRWGRSAWGLGRRSPAQRSAILGVAIVALAAIWYFLESVPGRIGLSILVLLVLPVFAIISFDRKGLRL